MRRAWTTVRDYFNDTHHVEIHDHTYAVLRHSALGTAVLAGDIPWIIDTIRERGIRVSNLDALHAATTQA